MSTQWASTCDLYARLELNRAWLRKESRSIRQFNLEEPKPLVLFLTSSFSLFFFKGELYCSILKIIQMTQSVSSLLLILPLQAYFKYFSILPGGGDTTVWRVRAMESIWFEFKVSHLPSSYITSISLCFLIWKWGHSSFHKILSWTLKRKSMLKYSA